MTKSLKILLVFLFTATPILFSHGQTLNTAYGGTVVDDLFISNSLMKSDRRLKYEQIEGSPYAYKYFMESSIVLKSGDVMEGIMTRINLYDNQLEVKDKENIYELRPEYLERVVYSGISYVYKSNLDNELESGFYKVYHKAEYGLYGISEIDFRQEETATNNYAESKPDRFVTKPEYFILELANGKMYSSNSKKQLLKSLKQNEFDIYEIIKNKKLNPTKKDDLLELINELEVTDL